MKRAFDEYVKIILYTIFGLILIMSSYIIIINIHHYKALSSTVVVSEVDSDYTKYKKTVNDIENVLSNYSKNNSLYPSLYSTFNVLKNGGVFRLIPNSKLNYHDLYELNDYFINKIINECWVSKLKSFNKNSNIQRVVDVLINNSKNLNNHFLDNGLTLYDSYNENKIIDDYTSILKNYVIFSEVILSISKG